MTGDAADMASRLRAMLPARWFPDPGQAPTLEALLGALGTAWAALFGQITYAQAQTRLRTVSDGFLDMAVADFRGTRQIRRPGESDAALRARFLPVLRDKATRAALAARIASVSGSEPWLFEPSRPADTGAYGPGAALSEFAQRTARAGFAASLGYNAAGGWGSLALPGQVFVRATRPAGQGIPKVSGYGASAGGYGGGAIAWNTVASEAPHVSDADLYAAAAEVLPAASIAWVSLTDAPAGGPAVLGRFRLGSNTLARGNPLGSLAD